MVIAIEVPVYLIWLVQVGYQAGQQLPSGDAGRWAPPVLLPLAAVLFCVMAGWTWWGAVVARTHSPLRERGSSRRWCSSPPSRCSAGCLGRRPVLSVGPLSAAVTTLGMIGLFFIPAAAAHQLPDVIRRRSRRTSSELS